MADKSVRVKKGVSSMKSIMLTVIILFAISTVAPLYPSPALAQQNTPDKAKGAKKGCRPGAKYACY